MRRLRRAGNTAYEVAKSDSANDRPAVLADADRSRPGVSVALAQWGKPARKQARRQAGL